MEDKNQKAKELKFLFYFGLNEHLANNFLFFIPLKPGVIIGLILLIMFEILYHYLAIGFIIVRDVSYIHAFIFSLARLGVFIYCLLGIEKNDFDQCEKGHLAMNIATLANLVSCLILFIGIVIFDLRLYNGWVVYIAHTSNLLFGAIFLAVNLYIPYIYFSFTKHLGLGNIELINGRNNTSITLQSGYQGVNTLIIGQGQVDSDMNNLNNTQLSVMEKIVLSNPLDIAFAQSAQDAIVSGISFPSGIKVPDARDGKTWKIIENEIILK
jgi:hypothetical protein